jgi:hypothetical protein
LSISFSNLGGQHQAEVRKIQCRLEAFGWSELREISSIRPL